MALATEKSAENSAEQKSDVIIEDYASGEDESLQSDNEEDFKVLSGGTVTASKAKKRGVSVQKYGKEKLEQEGVKRVSDALELLPSVQSGTTSRGERKFILRGFDDRQITVLVDGMPLLAPYTGRTDLSKIPAEIIKSIEVVKGGGSIAYGPQGLGGAINIVTRKAGSRPFLFLMYEMMELDGRSLSLTVSDSIKKRFKWLVAAGYDQQDGFSLPADFKETRNEDGGMRNNSDRFDWHLAAKGNYEINSNHNVLLDFTWFRGEYGVAPHTTEIRPRYWRWSNWEDLNVSLSHKGRYGTTLKIEESVFAVFLNNTLDNYDDETYETQATVGAFHSTYRDRIIGGRLKARAKFYPEFIRWLVLRGYFDVHHDYHESEWRGRDEIESTERVQMTIAPEMEISVVKYFSMLASFQAQVDLPIDNGGYQADDSWIWGPMLSFKFTLPKDIVIELSAARRGRFATLSEQYGDTGGSRVPNPSLKPESAWNIALDVSYKLNDIFILNAGGFHSEVFDLILETSLGGGRMQIQNLDRARLSGFELNAGLDIKGLNLEVGYAFLHAVSLDHEKDMEYMPEHKAFVSIAEKPIKYLRLATRVEFVGPQNFFNDDRYRLESMDSYVKWSARADVFPVEWLVLWLRVTNILDSSYMPRYGFPDPGRTFWVGIKATKD